MFNHVRRRLPRHHPYLLVDLDARYGPTLTFLRPRSLQGRRRRSSRRRSNSCSYDSDSGDEHHSTERAKRRWTRPPTSDGSTQSFATFRAQFDKAAAFNRWSENVQMAHLKSGFVSVAAQSLWDTPKDQTETLDKLWKLLEARYGGRNVMGRYRTELPARRHRAMRMKRRTWEKGTRRPACPPPLAQHPR